MQAAKIQRLSRHLMNARMKQWTTNRLKKNIFFHEKNKLLKHHPYPQNHKTKKIQYVLQLPMAMKKTNFLQFNPKYSTKIFSKERRAYTSKFLDQEYQKDKKKGSELIHMGLLNKQQKMVEQVFLYNFKMVMKNI